MSCCESLLLSVPGLSSPFSPSCLIAGRNLELSVLLIKFPVCGIPFYLIILFFYLPSTDIQNRFSILTTLFSILFYCYYNMFFSHRFSINAGQVFFPLLTLSSFPKFQALQRSILSQIEKCKQLEHLDSSARDELNPVDVQAISKIMIYYQNQLEERRHKMQVRETVLKDLEAFMASLRKIQPSIKCPPDQPEIQGRALREAAQEVAHLAEEAERLDERLKTVSICLEDAECGREICCGKLVGTLDKELNAIYDSPSERELAEDKDLYKTFSRKNSELLKNIQDLRDRIDKIGLKDPTVPAVHKR